MAALASTIGDTCGGIDLVVSNAGIARAGSVLDLDLQAFAQDDDVRHAKDIYITPGEHLKNGRKWRTSCEAYSQTQRCRTEIWGTSVESKGGKIVKRNGWMFNNLTYKASARSLWKSNPLRFTGKFTNGGRK